MLVKAAHSSDKSKSIIIIIDGTRIQVIIKLSVHSGDPADAVAKTCMS